MSLPVQTPIATTTANGVTTVFPFPFLISRAADLVVTLDDVPTSTGFTVSGIGVVTGGAVTFSVAPANGVEVSIRRHIPLSRAVDYQTGGDFREEVLDADLDRIWQAMQEIAAGFADGVIVIDGVAGNVTIIDAGGFFSGANVEAALQELGTLLKEGFSISKASTGPVAINIKNTSAGVASSARLNLESGTAGSSWLFDLVDVSGAPVALEKLGSAVTKKQTWADWHEWRSRDGTQGLMVHNGTTLTFDDSGGDNILQATSTNFAIGADVALIGISGGVPRMDIPASNGAYWIDGTRVIRARITGWSADTGTAKRTANATYSGTAEIAYTQATVQTLMDKVRDLSQTVKALKDDLISHGLIGS